ncbi:MAG: hypothetical protein V2I37_11590 [Marinilabiliaceae bacterium]|nr:hypothetical protein [Marinilabiliaceae bacterium]
MNRLLLLGIVLLLPCSMQLSGQEKVNIDKADFIIEKEGFKEAWYHVREGDKLYRLGGGLYPDAVEHYLKAYKFNSENAELNYKLGVASLFGNDQFGALNYFLKARSLKTDVAADLVLLTGRAYQFRGDYGRAIDFFNMYSDKLLENGKSDPEVMRYIKECNLAIENGLSEDFEIMNLGKNINSESDDYSPVLVKNEQAIYFTTRRQLSAKDELQGSDYKWNENVYIATATEGIWDAAGPAGTEVCTPLNEGVLYVDRDNTYMLLYAGWSGSGDIMRSEFDRGVWRTPESFMDETSTPYRETSIALSNDGEEVFFTSDIKKGNAGGRDIYYMRRVKKNKWTKPSNLGPLVNSGGNEEAVWTSATGDTIWFSSNGLQGYGGYDIFMSVRDISGQFSEPVNMGLPVNSQWDDLFYRPSVIDRREAYFSSNRPGGFGGLDIYHVKKIPAFSRQADSTLARY